MLNALTQFVLKNRTKDCFRLLTSEQVEKVLKLHLMEDSLVYTTDSRAKIVGILCWEIQEYFPLAIYFSDILCTEKWAFVDVLQKFIKNMPPSFRLFADRPKGRYQEYKNPRRLLALIERQYYGRRPVSTTTF